MRVRNGGATAPARAGWMLAALLGVAACGGVDPSAGSNDGAVSPGDDAFVPGDDAVVVRGDDGGANPPPTDVARVDGAVADVPVATADAPMVVNDGGAVITDAGGAPADTPGPTPDASECVTMSCNSGTCSLTLNVDVPVATVTGRITHNGAVWPMTTTRSGLSASTTADFFLRATDTGALHTLASIDYSNTAPYTRAAGSDAFSTTMIPGAYELVYKRGGDALEIGGRFNNDAVVTGFRVLRAVTINPGAQTLNIDVPVATVTGRITQNGAVWPMTSTRSGSAAVNNTDFLLRSADTGALHELASIDYSGTAPYTRAAGSDAFSTTVIPGTYELLYRRAWSAGDVGRQFNNDAVVTGYRVLRTVVINPGAQTLNIDVPVATVTGRITQNGAVWPMTSTRSGSAAVNNTDFLLRSADTGALHEIASIDYSGTAPYTRAAGSDTFSSTIIPGTYELLYRRAWSAGDVGARFNNDAVVTGFRVLRTVTINPGAQTLNIDVPVATVTGRVTQNGATWPMTSTRGGSIEDYAEFLLRSADTGALHVITSIGYSGNGPYTRAAGSDAFSTTIIPGAYELLYRRGWTRGDVRRQFNNDPVITGFRVLRSVTITPGAQTLNIDVPVATVTGRATQGGATWPMTSTRAGNVDDYADFLLRSADTGALHVISSIGYSGNGPYTRAAGSDAFSTTIIPGAYELLYRRGGSAGEVSARFNNDPVITGYRVLRSVTVSPGTQTLNIDLPVVNLSGRLTQAGLTWPTTSTRDSSGSAGSADVFLRARDTQALHRVASIRYGGAAPYTRPAGSELYATTLLPGAYDLVYGRGRYANEVAGRFNGDPVVTGFRVLRTCVSVP